MLIILLYRISRQVGMCADVGATLFLGYYINKYALFASQGFPFVVEDCESYRLQVSD